MWMAFPQILRRTVYNYLVEEGKRALDAEGIKIPYQQMDVHIRQD